uniref:Uncharacterized protein n=1 Tax=Curvibacter symbiont subsp. Hydra magnipapillata TaxID=667019 RepID=C9YCM5_CURXX|nr:hypothetical protein Csp_C24540 [Curvibacter putative symbiont of Hydra magnipapillata]
MREPVQPKEFGYLWTEMPVAPMIRNFISNFRNHDDVALITQAEPVNAYIQARESDELALWDICLYSPRSENPSTISFGQFTPNTQSRSSLWKRSQSGLEYIAVSGKALRVGGRGQAMAGMGNDDKERAKNTWTKESDIPDYHLNLHRTRPLLMLHVLDIWDKEKDKEKENPPKEPSVVAWGIAFPNSGVKAHEVTYVVNTTWWAENYGKQEDDTDED